MKKYIFFIIVVACLIALGIGLREIGKWNHSLEPRLQTQQESSDTTPPAPQLTALGQQLADAAYEKEQHQHRIEVARKLEETYLSNGQSVTISVDSSDDRRLNFRYALVSKAFAYHMEHQEPELNRQLYSVGFRSVMLTDGYQQYFDYAVIGGF